MKTKDKQISNRNKIRAVAFTGDRPSAPPSLLTSSTIGSPAQPPSFRTSSLSLRTFLIAKRKIRNCPNSRLFNTLDFSNREKSRFRHRAFLGGRSLSSDIHPAALLGVLTPEASRSFLIYTLKIRNRRKPYRITNLNFSNLYKTRAFFSFALGRKARWQRGERLARTALCLAGNAWGGT